MEKTIFVVDDSHTNLYAAEEALENFYNVITVPSGEKCIAMLDKLTPNLILLDIEMPGMDGFDVLKFLKEHPKHKDIPVIFLTALMDNALEARGFEMGVMDFIIKPFSASVLLNRIKLHLDTTDAIIKRTAELLQAHQNMIFILADIIETRDEYTGGHIERTAMFMRLLIQGMQEEGVYPELVGEWDPKTMAESSLLHDIGKINISDTILNKPGRLTPEEFGIMKGHAAIGKRIIEKIIERSSADEFLVNAKMFAEFHHERWDGSGYPYGLAGHDIPIHGRLMGIVDVYDALISERPYKKPFTDAEAIEIIHSESGKHFDPAVVAVFNKIHSRMIQAKQAASGMLL